MGAVGLCSFVAGLWGIVLILQILLALIAVAAKPVVCSSQTPDHDEWWKPCDFSSCFFLMLTTFNGSTWGHLIPMSVGQRIACVVSAMSGYLFWPLAALAAANMMVLGATSQAKRGLVV